MEGTAVVVVVVVVARGGGRVTRSGLGRSSSRSRKTIIAAAVVVEHVVVAVIDTHQNHHRAKMNGELDQQQVQEYRLGGPPHRTYSDGHHRQLHSIVRRTRSPPCHCSIATSCSSASFALSLCYCPKSSGSQLEGSELRRHALGARAFVLSPGRPVGAFSARR